MQYQTVIEIVADAENKNEAIDIAGEFLRGNIESGVRMKCHAKPLKTQKLFKAGLFFTKGFKKAWQKKKDKEVPEYIKE